MTNTIDHSPSIGEDHPNGNGGGLVEEAAARFAELFLQQVLDSRQERNKSGSC